MNERTEFPCEECGGMVDLSREVVVSLYEPNGSRVETRMSEYEARRLLDETGIPRPPVLCEREERREIVTEAVG